MIEKEGLDEELQQLLDTNSELKRLFGLNLNNEKCPISIYRTAACELALYFDEEAIFQIFDEYLLSDAWKSWDSSQRKNRLHDVITEATSKIEAKKSEEKGRQSTTTETKNTKEAESKNIPENIQTLITNVKKSDLKRFNKLLKMDK